jgi:hypothetical protein
LYTSNFHVHLESKSCILHCLPPTASLPCLFHSLMNLFLLSISKPSPTPDAFSRLRLPNPSRSHLLSLPCTVSFPTYAPHHLPMNQNASSQKPESNKNTQRNTSLTYPHISPSLLIALSTLVALSTVDALSTSILELPSLGPYSCVSRPSCSCSCSRLISAMRSTSLFRDHRATKSPAARTS